MVGLGRSLSAMWIRPRAAHWFLQCSLALTVSAVPTSGQYPSNQLHIIAVEDSASLKVDPNGFLLNPHWLGNQGKPLPMIEHACRFRVNTKHLERRSPMVTVPTCLSPDEQQLLTLNEAPQTLGIGAECVTGSKTGQVRGHINWFPVTATGETQLESFSSGAFDHDVNVDLLTPLPNASTGANTAYKYYESQRGYHNEFYSQETLERIPHGSRGFWADLSRSLGRHHNQISRDLVDRRVATITGIYGVDGVHAFHAELHPVFVMALLIKSDGTGRETWAVMLRNLGSEGDCAYGMIPMLSAPTGPGEQEYTLDLGPAPGNARAPSLSLEESFSSDTSYMPHARMVTLSGSGETHLYVIFPHPRPLPAKRDFTFLGTIDLDWHGVTPSVADPPCPKQLHVVSGTHPSRLSSWLPQYCHPQINLDYSESSGSPRQNYVPTEDDVAPKLLTIAARPLSADTQVIDLRRPALRVYAAAAWPLVDSVTRCCERSAWSRAQSLSGRRFVIGASMLRLPIHTGYWHQVTPVVGYYVYPHSASFIGEGLLAEVVNYLSLLGYRLDMHGDQFFPVSRSGSSIQSGRRRGGTSLALSTFLAPNTLRVGVDLTPYTIAHIGASCLGNLEGCVGLRDVKATWGWGLGLQVQTPVLQDFFIELQEAVRAGGYTSHWVCNAGWLLPLGR